MYIAQSKQWSTPIPWHISGHMWTVIVSIFVNCSSIAGQETLIWHDNVRFQCVCGTACVCHFCTRLLFFFAIITVGSVGALRWSVVLLASLIGPTLDRLRFFAGDIKIWMTDCLTACMIHQSQLTDVFLYSSSYTFRAMPLADMTHAEGHLIYIYSWF